ncbi:MAG: ribose 5-phosphate isomerase B [Clostridiales bacterium]|nr:ribose 5-phosphate isomerase B [Clostridiales bacterium]
MLAIGCDHGGFELKNHIIGHLKERGVQLKDFGTYDETSCDYPDIAGAVCNAIVSGECENGILVCGTGIGMSIAANKVKGIRAALCTDVYSAKMTKQHNNSNVICLGGRVTGRELAFLIVDTWLDETFLGGRHQNRIDKIHLLEK